ncbi:class D sortase [Clostridium celatum]|uniref:Sortase family protein n=1 Tax=Clostridium celatum DSM 1785 TaxID=545697 RepID=L1QL34_9CLOT|nr:class D sortase [Clostridium celatum]EKY28651.1 sortase family protein [Clostridium celatum DSM 1785]MCE9654907.1 class D sortase [Clostridium celatum]MDU2265339.1 class D sortase [Clostridium celatum]MDU3723787.1 class D sortase [Clostridium celatum]MDU6294971.1 class D sortase [Clostridium celatum]
MDKFRRIVGVILILVGVFIVGDVVYKKIETNKKQQQMIDLFEGQITGEKQEGENASQEVVSLDDINGYSPIAIMEIPRIKLKQAIVTGIDDNTLQYFLGHFPDSAMPGEVGNFAVAGHRVSDYTDAFINLYKVKAGDEVIINTRDKKYTYEIDDNFIVDPSDVEVLEKSDYEKITLITCTVGAKQRVVVTGKLIKTEDINNG